jgi:hypothetical protein
MHPLPMGEDRGEGIRPHGFPLPNPLPQGEGTDPVPWDRVLHGAARFFSLSLWVYSPGTS